jgi:hypothetical protein
MIMKNLLNLIAQMKYMFKNPFSFKGRINSTEYILSLVLSGVMAIISGLFLLAFSDSISVTIIGYLLWFVLVWFFLAQGSKRCHDRNESGWHQFIPFYQLSMVTGDSDTRTNKYGLNPKETLVEPEILGSVVNKFWQLARKNPLRAYEFFNSSDSWFIIHPNEKKNKPTKESWFGPFFMIIPGIGRIKIYGKSNEIELKQLEFVQNMNNLLSKT